MSIAFSYVTSRVDCRIEWWFQSLAKQIVLPSQVIVIDHYAGSPTRRLYVEHEFRKAFSGPLLTEQAKGNLFYDFFVHAVPKPTIWQGDYRITAEDWWAKSNALNTAICLCRQEWLCVCDDRSLLMPNYFNSVVAAMRSNVAVCGNYEKRMNMKVVDGVISDPGITLGSDNRTQHSQPYHVRDWYGGSGALPLEWCLAVNGFSEDLCDGLGSEDSMFGVTLRNSGYPIMYDPRMLIIEDRTPGEIDGALKRADKGVSPNDKSHKIVEIMRDKTTSQNSFDIRHLRNRVLAGEPFPPPSASYTDWFDGQPIKDMI